MKQRLIAINLPQFHPFKENDEWWGKGFTEWTNVTKARPRFKGHYQPHLPTDTGFYDLRLPEARQMQADMAKEYGIYGFCYYHYWFNGKQLMERPVNDILKSGEPDFPFMLCWANENWTRAWDGYNKDILIGQNYSDEDDRAHMKFLCDNYFKDPRYIRIDGKPVFCIYRSTMFPNIERSIKIMREEAKRHGEELYLIRFESWGVEGAKYLDVGFDAAMDWQPKLWSYNKFADIRSRILWRYQRLRSRFRMAPISTIVDYENYTKIMMARSAPSYKRYPCVTPMWDNSPRREGRIFWALQNSTPLKYKKWLKDTLIKFTPYSKEENLVFINAWNEWAEGNHLEPDAKWGRQYLESTKAAYDEIVTKRKE